MNGPPSFLSHRFDFDTAVFAGPIAGAVDTASTAAATTGDAAGGSCQVDQITVTQTSATIGGFENLCGTLSGQHSNNFNINF